MSQNEVGSLIDEWAVAAASAASLGAWDSVGKLYARVREAVALYGPVFWRGRVWSFGGRLYAAPVPPAKVGGFISQVPW